MTIAVKAISERGVFRPLAPVRLKEATEVEVLVPTDDVQEDDPTGWKAIDALTGIGQAVASDVSERHDDDLYNDPRA